MKELSMLVWLTQLGLSVAVPLAGFIWLALWLRSKFGLGNWILFVGLVLGFKSAIDGFRTSLKAMERMDRGSKNDKHSSAAPRESK